MGADQLVDIYRRHIHLLNDGEGVFSEEALEWLERGSGGQVGMFLRRCRQLWQRFFLRPAGTLIGAEQIREHVRKEVLDLVRDPDYLSLMTSILATVRQGQMQLALTREQDPGALRFTVLQPDPVQDRYMINPIYFEVLNELLKKGVL